MATPAEPPATAAGERTAAAMRGSAIVPIVLVFAALYYAQALFAPLVVAVLANFLLAPVVRALHRRHVPRAATALLLLAALVGGVGGVVYELAGPAADWMQRLPDGVHRFAARLEPVRQRVDQVNAAARKVESMAVPPGEAPPVTVAPPSTVATNVVSFTGELVAGSALTLITLAFLLVSGGTLLERAVRLIPGAARAHEAQTLVLGNPEGQDTLAVLRESERLVCLYLATTVTINVGLGVAVGAGFWLVGLPNPVLWGAVVAGLNFLPYIGPFIGVPTVALASAMSFDHLGQAVAAPLVYATCAFIEGNFITPLVVGRRLAMSPLAVFLWMALWAWMWGAIGALVAVPLLVMIKEFCVRIERLRGIAEVIER